MSNRKPFGDWRDDAQRAATGIFMEAWAKARAEIEARSVTDPVERERIMREALALIAPLAADEVELHMRAALARGWRHEPLS